MERKDSDNIQKNSESNDISNNQNQSLKDPAASSVADYGKSEQSLDDLEQKHGRSSGKGNSSIPMENEDTLGIP